MDLSKFYVVAVISNPIRYQSRYKLYQQFKKHMGCSGILPANLFTVEQGFGDRPFQITTPEDPMNLQLRTFYELWHKENMINQAIERLPKDWEYVAWVDADIQFLRPDWVQETVQQLQHHMVVQMWETAIDLGPSHEALHIHKSFISEYLRKGSSTIPDGYYSKWHPGFAWAARREAIDDLGGMIDIGILGSGDRHMAGALIGHVDKTYNNDVHSNYKKIVHEWQNRAERYVRRDVGFVSGTIAHYWHGKKKDRKYADRWKILVDNQYDPLTDIKRDWQGLFQLCDLGTPRSLSLRDDIRAYFRARNEDSIDLA